MALSPSIQAGQKRSLELMSQMRALAAKLPGEAKDYINAFALTLPEAIAAGERDTKKYADFISHYMAVALTKGMDAPQAGRDLVEMLQGRAHLRTATYQKLRVQIGMLATEFNKLTPEERYRRITEAIAQSGSGMAFAAETANAKFGELKSRLEEIAAIGGKPFFEAVKSSVTEINKFLQENNVLINSITQSIATGMGDALRGVVSYMKDIVSLAASYKDEISIAVDFLKATQPMLGLVSSAASAIAGRGKEQRLQEEQAAQTARAARISKVMAAYPEAEKMLPEVRAPSGMLDVSTVNKEYRESLKKTLKEMWVTSKGKMADIFKTSEDWATFVEAKGTAWGIDPQSLWDEMVAEKKIKIPVIEAKTRELKVEFNNNRFDIHQQFAEGFDPDRIAVAFASDLARAGEMKVQAAFSPIYGAGQ